MLDAAGITPEELLDRHADADWGDVSPEICELNERGVWYYRWITNRYWVGGECVLVITTGGRGRTMISLA